MYRHLSLWALVLTFLPLASIPHANGGDDFNNFVKPDPLPTHFAIDVNDTFYVEDPAVFKRNVAAFKWLRNNNVVAFFCTGRSLDSNRNLLGDDFFNETGYNGHPGVYRNGAIVYGPDGTVIKSSKLSDQYLDKVNQYVIDNNQQSNVLFYTSDKKYVLTDLSDEGKQFIKARHMSTPETVTFDKLKEENIISISFFNLTIPDDLKRGLHVIDYSNDVCKHTKITPEGCNKKSALDELLKNLNVDVNRCAFIGDNNNDAEVMEYCPNSFAVGNATDKAKEKAKWVLKTKHDEGAFEEVVKKMYGYDPDSKPTHSDGTPTTPHGTPLSEHTSGDHVKDFTNFIKPNPVPTHFAIDVDGTFYVQDENVFKRNVEAFKWLRNNNVLAFFCTGRDHKSNITMFGDDFFTDTGYNGYPGIYANGSLVYDAEGNAVRLMKLTDQYLDKINRYITDNNHQADVLFYTDDGTYVLKDPSDAQKTFLETKKMAEPEVVSFDVLKLKNVISIALFNLTLTDDLKQDVCHVQYCRRSYTHIQISPLNSTKKSGLEALLPKLGASANECAFIGDNNNDAEVMEYCPNSFAVGNATDKAKEKAKWILKTKHDEGAFEEVVKKMYGYNPGITSGSSDSKPAACVDTTTIFVTPTSGDVTSGTPQGTQ